MGGERSLELESLASLDDTRDVWSTLADRSGNLFATWEWASTWWSHFGSQGSLRISVARDRSGSPAAIVPLYLAKRGQLRILRFIGHGVGDWLGPICAPGEAAAAGVAVREALSTSPDWDVFLAENVRADDCSASRREGAVLRNEAFPILPFRGRTWEELLLDRSANFRQQVRRRERGLTRAHALRFRMCSDPARLDADMDLLFALHSARWARGQTRAFSEARRAFHRAFAHLALARGWLRLWVMELDSTPVAAWYGFRYAGVEWYYQSGRDPAYERESVGFVLLCHTIRTALEDGAGAYWLLRGGETYKDRFAEEDPGLCTSAAARTLRGRAAIGAARVVRRAPAGVRRWVGSRIG